MSQCLQLSNDSASPHLNTIVDSTFAIAFLGTPHAGAESLAKWATRSAKVLGLGHSVNEQIVAVLKTDSEVLAIQQQGFHNMLRAREPKQQIDITCFFEQLELPVVGFVSCGYYLCFTKVSTLTDLDFLGCFSKFCYSHTLEQRAARRQEPYEHDQISRLERPGLRSCLQ